MAQLDFRFGPQEIDMADLAGVTAAIEAGDRLEAVRTTQQAMDQGVRPQVILDAMTEAMAHVGMRFQSQEIFVPEMLISARAMKEATAILEPALVGAGIRPDATAVIGTVEGDLHDIGKNLVAMMWRGAHIEVVDLGTNVPPQRFAEAAIEHHAEIVGISALLTTTMVGMREAVAAIRARDLPGIRIIVGGAPVTSEFADEIGADGFAPDAGAAVDVAKAAIRAYRGSAFSGS